MTTEPGPSASSWRKYAFEFLMLFLAVFLGFVAENFREDYGERQQAAELARNFVGELRNDSIVIAEKYRNRLRKEEALIYLMTYFRDSSLSRVPKEFAVNFFIGVSARTPFVFEARTVVLDQLKNSGSLRFFKSNDIQNLIGDLTVTIRNINDRQEVETNELREFVTPLLIRHFDYDFEVQLGRRDTTLNFKAILDYEKSNEVIPFHFKGLDKFQKEEAINSLGLYYGSVSSTRKGHFRKYMEVNAKLLAALRKEYY
ncbi:MAG: hypothetical protein JST46_18785 [Bacteroidetes bacterium]|nr:hypothetical protein [Bacteroidota bacterium]